MTAGKLAVFRIFGVTMLTGQPLFRWWPSMDRWIWRHLTYRRLVHHHKGVRPWTVAECLWLVLYVGAIITVVVICRVHQNRTTGSFGPFLAINMVPLYLGHAHDVPAQALGLSLQRYARMHRIVAVACMCLAVAHVCVTWDAIDRNDLKWNYWTGCLGASPLRVTYSFHSSADTSLGVGGDAL